MDQPLRFVLRVTYIKRDRLALLSHLEVARALERTVRRSGLPFAVSQGFSPHMKIAFGAALPVGVGSTCEIFDIQLTRYVAPDEALAALREASVADLMAQDAAYIDGRAKAASVAYPISVYEAVFSHAPEKLQIPQQITRRRKNKKDKVLNVSDFLVEPFTFDADDPRRARFALMARNDGSLRPDLLIEECVRSYNEAGREVLLEVRSVTRVQLRER